MRSNKRPDIPLRSSNGMIETVLQDLRYGIRSLVKPAFAIVSTVTLALAIGINTAIFSLVNAIVFADLPMDDPSVVTISLKTKFENEPAWRARHGIDADLCEYLQAAAKAAEAR